MQKQVINKTVNYIYLKEKKEKISLSVEVVKGESVEKYKR